MKTIKELIIKYKELIRYVFFGGCTTVVNLVVFKLFNVILGDDKYLISNVIAWVASVVFAYITNKIWVFESKQWNVKTLFREVPSFFAARVASFLIEELGLYVLVDLLRLKDFTLDVGITAFSGEMISKALLAVFVVVLNYVFSKVFIFRKKKKSE